MLNIYIYNVGKYIWVNRGEAKNFGKGNNFRWVKIILKLVVVVVFKIKMGLDHFV